MVPWAVITITGTCEPCSRSDASSSSPLTSGMRMSAMTRSTGDDANCSSASRPLAALSTRWPMRCSIISSTRRILGSSSATRMYLPVMVVLSSGQTEAEQCTAGRTRVGLYLTVMRVNDPLHDSQAEADAAFAPEEERFEHLRALGFRDAGSVVGDFDGD